MCRMIVWFVFLESLGPGEHVRYSFHINPIRRNDFRAICELKIPKKSLQNMKIQNILSTVKSANFFLIPWCGRIMAAHPFYVSYDHMVCIFWKA